MIAATVTIENCQLVVDVSGCIHEAIEVLVQSGHAIQGRRRSLNGTDHASSNNAARFGGVWILKDDELEGIWIQCSSGMYVDICAPLSLREARDASVP